MLEFAQRDCPQIHACSHSVSFVLIASEAGTSGMAGTVATNQPTASFHPKPLSLPHPAQLLSLNYGFEDGSQMLHAPPHCESLLCVSANAEELCQIMSWDEEMAQSQKCLQ